MVCQNCGIPMKTEDGSERGEIRDNYYYTREIKYCQRCEKRVEEKYSAEIINKIIQEI